MPTDGARPPTSTFSPGILPNEVAAVAAVVRDVLATEVDDGVVGRNGPEPEVPADYGAVIAAIAGFADPILTGDVSSGEWDPATCAWTA